MSHRTRTTAEGPGPRRLRLWGLAAGLVSCALLSSGVSASAPISTAFGYDYSSGPDDQTTHSLLGAAALAVGGGDVFVTGLRYDNDLIGPGTGLLVGGGLPLGVAQLRLTAMRFTGQDGYRDVRIKAGPLVGLPGERTLGVYYTHDDSNIGPGYSAASAELGFPVAIGLTGRATAGVTVLRDGPSGANGSLGATWAVLRRFEIQGEVGFTETATAGPGQPVPVGRRGLRDLLLPSDRGDGTPGEGSIERSLSFVSVVGVRVVLP